MQFTDNSSPSPSKLGTGSVQRSSLSIDRSHKRLSVDRSLSLHRPRTTTPTKSGTLSSLNTTPTKHSNASSLSSSYLYPSSSPSSTSTIPINVPDLPTFAKSLLQASHAECLNGTTADLLTILNRGGGAGGGAGDSSSASPSPSASATSTPWGFDYRDIDQSCKVWWGSEDDKISEKSVRWMQSEMGCEVEIVKGQGHNLMTVSRVMFDVFESLSLSLAEVRV